MKVKQATKELKRFNKWRRGAEITISSPIIIGEAIDTIVEYLENEFKKK